MADCLAPTGGDLSVPVVLALALCALGVGAVLVLRPRRAGRSRRTAPLALAVAVVIGLATGHLAAAPATAAGECGTISGDTDAVFVSGGATFRGSYRGPIDPSRPVAAAVIVGGTGAVDRDGDGAGIPMKEYEWLADLLAAQGVASLRYDKLGTGATGLGPGAEDPGILLSSTYDRLRVQPVRDALAFVAAQDGIDAGRLLLVGHSEGGAVTLTVASDPGGAPAPAGLLLVEPAYTRILDIVPSQLSGQMDAAVAAGAMASADAAALKAWMMRGVDEIRAAAPPFAAPGPAPLPDATGYTAVMQSTIEGNVFGSDPTQMVLSHAFRTLYGKQFDEIDPADLAPSIAVPVLVTCGAEDVNTPCGDATPGSGVAWLASRFEPGTARLVELEGTVHILRDIGSADAPTLADQVAHPFSTRLADALADFVAAFRD